MTGKEISWENRTFSIQGSLVSKTSTQLNVLITVSAIETKQLSEDDQGFVLTLLDLQKTYDTVNKQTLLSQLRKMEFVIFRSKRTQKNLKNKRQCVELSTVKSDF